MAHLRSIFFLCLLMWGGKESLQADPQTLSLIHEGNDESTLTVFLPEAGKSNGAAVIICPGGGYAMVSMEVEGTNVAKWFNDQGVAGIVLKYRLPGKNGNAPTVVLDDGKAALRQVREHASQWGIDPHRVGIMGFSAGAHVAVMAGTHYDPDTRPDFMLLIYPVISMGEFGYPGCIHALMGDNPDPDKVKFYSGELNVTSDTPPTFLAQSQDDKTVDVRNSIDFYTAMVKNKVPGELHLYEVGGHGMKGGSYGIGPESSFISSTWNDRALDWLKFRGLLKPSDAPPSSPAL